MFWSNIISVFTMLSPPFLAFFAWKKFLAGQNINPAKPSWRVFVEWLALLSISTLFVVCVVAFFTIPCDVARYGWGCVRKWRSFWAPVVKRAPFFFVFPVFWESRGVRKKGNLDSFVLVGCWGRVRLFDGRYDGLISYELPRKSHRPRHRSQPRHRQSHRSRLSRRRRRHRHQLPQRIRSRG